MDKSVTPFGEPECWLPVVDWEDRYEVSDLGRVWSLPRVVRFGHTERFLQGQMLNTLSGPRKGQRYVLVTLWRGNEKRSVAVHILVAAAFLGPKPPGHEVCHGPGGALDNRLANLSYGTRAKNMGPDKHRDGTMPVGVRVHGAKLNDEIVCECRARAAAGETIAALACEFDVGQRTMWCAVRGETWRHLPVPGVPGRDVISLAGRQQRPRPAAARS